MQSLGTINNIHDVIKAAGEAKAKLQTDIWWRGQAVATWRLAPGVYRGGRGPRDEQNMALVFAQRAGTRYDKCPGWEEWDSWLFLMRHYWLPTRLLDWTESPLIAAYFAVNEQAGEAASLWALSPSRLNKLQSNIETLLHPRDARAWRIFEGAFREQIKDRLLERVVAVAAKEVDIRMLVQLSTFTIHGTATPVEELEGKEKFLIRFDIPASSKQTILDDLAGLGITQSRLFPDLEHLARELASAKFPQLHEGYLMH